MDRYRFLPSYHYVENENGVINNPATDKVRTCTISGNHGKNLIPFPYVSQAGTQNGVTITIDSVGVITLNGTATASVYFGLLTVTQAITKPGKYTISGAPGIAGVSVQCKVDGAWTGASVDTGNGATFTVTQQIDQVTVQINKGTMCDNVVVKPMLEEGETKTDFEPWQGVGDETKNILPYPYADTTKTMNGITFTDNGDGSITVNGTATAAARITLRGDKYTYGRWIPKGKYLLSANLDKQSETNIALIWQGMGDGGAAVKQENSTNLPSFINTTELEYKWDNIFIYINPGVTIDNLTFKPMLVDLTTQNLIPYPYARTTQTINGITFTDNKDGTITVNGTATDTAWYPFSTLSKSTVYATKGKYYLSGCPSGGNAATKYNMGANVFNDETQVFAFDEIGNGRTVDLNSYTFTSISVNFTVREGVTVDNLTFRPLLVNMDDVSSYEPYGYKIPIANDTRENLLNVEDFTETQDNNYYAVKEIQLTDSNMRTYLPYLDEMKGKSVVYSCDLDNENFAIEFVYFYDVKNENRQILYVQFQPSNNFTATLPNATPIRLGIRARSNSADLKGTAVKFSNISLKLADVDPDTTNIYTPKQIMQGESATFNEPFKLSKANQLSVETAVKPSAVKYTYYTY
nr:MAG TPA: hypothetical protein [Caudoviricetes sp.]